VHILSRWNPPSGAVKERKKDAVDMATVTSAHDQNEVHVLFYCPVSNRLRDFISQADTKGLALYVHECLDCCA